MHKITLCGGTNAATGMTYKNTTISATRTGALITTYEGIDEIVYTSTKNAFTPGDNGKGLIYTYYGIPSEEWMTKKAAGSSSNPTTNNYAKIVSGTYVGTGTYGSSNPMTLTFDFTPKYVFVSGKPVVSGT
jgi:hypothetical protein